MRYPQIKFQACNRKWILRKADMEALWQNMVRENEERRLSRREEERGGEDDERLPYWAELWPSSLALAEWLHEKREDIQGKKCLDMGCGQGFTALVGRWLGAEVTGMDYEEQALAFARANAMLNGVEGVHWQAMDWRDPALSPHSLDVIWAGDVMYERGFASPIANFLAHCLTKQGCAWIAEPGRDVFIHLLRELQQYKLVPVKMRTVDIMPLIPQKQPVPVNIWEIRQP